MADTNPQSETGEHTMVLSRKTESAGAPADYEPYLIHISGRETGQMHSLAARDVTIGRDPDCQISLDDLHVSRHHAEVVASPDGDLVIRDLGSTNGVFVNGHRVTEHVLVDGDKILIGTNAYLKFCYQDSVDHTYQQNLFRAANIDGLTQLYNKRYFIDVLSKEFSFSRRTTQPLSLMMIDIDHFKTINDTFGHMAGDAVLRHMGQHLHTHQRLENVACRYGGEEFAVILRNAGAADAHLVAERLRCEIESTVVEYRGEAIHVTVSIGIASMDNGNTDTIDDLIHAADERLYRAKTGGRNRTVHLPLA